MSDDDMIRREDAVTAAYEADSLELSQHGAVKIAERLAALPAAAPVVKPLVWEALEVPDIAVFEVLTCLGRYKVQERTVPGWMLVGTNGAISVHDSEKAAKAAAQADYEARILSALAPSPARDVREAALIDGMRQIANQLSCLDARSRGFADRILALIGEPRT